MAEMLRRHSEQGADVVVVESIVDVTPVAPVRHDAGRAQQSERLGHVRLGGTDGCGDLVHAQLVVLVEGHQDVDPRRVTEQSERGRESGDRRPIC